MDLTANRGRPRGLPKDVSTSPPRSFSYIPALDGVRALSLAAILVFHSHFTWARGGFLGVSVFFTLSGFLITSLLLSERERTGRISLRSFWVRRARRLAPAVLVLFAIVAALLAGGLLVGKASVAGDALATAGWSANWRFVFSGQAYGDLFSQPSPFQHMWSLAVEEQFYLLFPGLLLLLLGRSERVHRWRAGLVVLGCIGLSTWLCAFLAHPGDVERSYYGTDTRMAEPFVGVLLALLLTRDGAVRVLHRWARVALDVAAVGALVALGYLVHGYSQYSDSLFTGGLLLVAVLSAIVLAGVTQPGSWLGRVLGVSPLAFLGKISYGGYVFHWPIYLWLTPERTGLSEWPLLALRVGLTLLVATLSYAIIEEPVRLSKKLQVSIALPAWAATTTLVLAGVVLASGAVTPAPARVTASSSAFNLTDTPVPPLPTAASRPHKPAVKPAAPQGTVVVPGTTTAVVATPQPTTPTRGTTTTPTRPGAPTQQPTKGPEPVRVAVIGDSLADNLGGGLTRWAQEQGNVLIDDLAIPGCPLAYGGVQKFPDKMTRKVPDVCGWWADPSHARTRQLQQFDPDVIVIQDGMNELVERKLDEWPAYMRVGQATFDEWMLQNYRDLLDVINPTGERKVMLLNAVCANWNRTNHFNGFQLELDNRITSLNRDYDLLSSQTGVDVKDLRGNICPGGRFSDTVDGVPDARPDGYHLSEDAATAVATTWLGPLCLDAIKQG
jgi:peptidoglycan/LPS O-acetylase OafA/YrhL